MPSGLYYHEDCIHQFDEPFHVEELTSTASRISFQGSERAALDLPPCPHAPRLHPNSSMHSRGAQASYYSDWVAYTQTVHKQGFGSMSSVWNVPTEPTSKGPAPPLVESSIYFFNGLENSGGEAGTADVILQPVLQYGKSGCLLDPLKWGAWYLTAYQVGINGRAYCGASLGPLQAGEQVLGTMTLTDPGSNTWRVDAQRLGTGDVSTHSVALADRVLDAAYATLEGMVIYSCQAFPASGSVSFSENKLADTQGQAVSASWQKMLGHTECAQDVQMPSSDRDSINIVSDVTKSLDNDVVV